MKTASQTCQYEFFLGNVYFNSFERYFVRAKFGISVLPFNVDSGISVLRYPKMSGNTGIAGPI